MSVEEILKEMEKMSKGQKREFTFDHDLTVDERNVFLGKSQLIKEKIFAFNGSGRNLIVDCWK